MKISNLEKPSKKEDILAILHPFVKEWFLNKFEDFSLPQLFGVLEIHNKNNILISAPTGGTKTLTAFLSILNELVCLSDQNLLEDKTYAIYISPLKALSNDIHINLVEPLKEINEIAKKHKKKLNIRVGLRTGDTSTSKRQKMLRKPSHILVSTPESLAITLTSPKFKETLKDVKYFILDEIHSLAESKRGTDLSLSLERLQYNNKEEITRIGLSASIAPLDKIAQFLVGSDRNCKIANINFPKKLDMKVLSPLKDLINSTHEEIHSSMYSLIDDLIQSHRTTLIFTNTRAATERVVHHLKEKFPTKYTENIGAHHGSLSKDLRHNLEERLRQGKLKAVVSSTSLELGLDIGYIDLVICLGSPKSIARLLQRAGRSGHKLHDTIKARVIVLDRDDLIECSVMLRNVIKRNIDKIHIPENCLDVLAQQIYGIAISNQININNLFSLIKKAYPFRDLTKQDFMEVIKFLSGAYSELEERHVYAKIWYDQETKMIGKKGKLARVIYMTNIGTIPSESFVKVKVGEQIIGHIDEAFLERLKKGDVFVLGGERYEFRYSKGMTAFVNASVYRPPTIPAWFSEMLPLNFDLALEIQRFRKLIEEQFTSKKSKKEILEFINSYLYVDEYAKLAIYNYFEEQFKYIKEIPNLNKIVIEHYTDEENKKYVIFHTLFGRRVNDVLSRAVAYSASKIHRHDFELGITDNGFYLASEKNIQALNALKQINSKNLNEIMNFALEHTEVLKRRFRHCAARSLMILRSYKGHERTTGRQQVSSNLLINAVKRISLDFPIYKEAKREVLEDLMDVANAKLVLDGITQSKIKIKEVTTLIPSPFAFNIVLEARADVYKIEDKVEFLRRMHNLVLAKISLNK